jgi:ParB/RepB/Spo0J family partition protein
MLKTIELSTSCIKPNNYNPNMMTETEFNELINEMRRLKRIPKPIVVRKNDTGFVIVDGEHSWRAAKEIGLEKVTCEIIVADDFESMHQTYKRNQHGTHNPVLLGKMFKRMKKERSLSNRALAKEMEVSEGTVRNALLYAEAAEVRNDYAFEKLSVKQLRYLNMLPEKVRDLWLNSGADILALFNAIAPEQVKPLTSKKKDDIKFWLGDYGPQEWEEGSSVEAEFLGQYHGLIEDGLLDVYFPDASPDDAESFMRLIHRVKKWHKFEREHFSPWFSKNYKELKAQWRRFVISFLKRWRTDALA